MLRLKKVVSEEPPENLPQVYACPQCGTEIPAPADASVNLLTCPQCANQFFIGSEDEADEQARAAAEAENTKSHEEELSGLKIRQLSRKKRAAIRTRSYFLIGGFACIVAAAELIYLLIKRIQHQMPGWEQPVGFVAFALALLLISPWFFRRAAAWKAESERSSLEEPADAPDFSTLSDGSQQVKNLEDIR